MRRMPPGRVPPDMDWERPDPDELTIEEIMGFIRARCPVVFENAAWLQACAER